MSPVFIRSDQIQEIVFDVKLRIPEWKVLFAVDGKMDSMELAAFLEMQESSVSATLKKLEELNLLTLVGNGQVSDTEAVVDIEQAEAETVEAETVEAETPEAEDEKAEIEESDIEFSIEEEEEFEGEVEQEAAAVEMEEEEEIFAEPEEEILAEDLSSEEADVSEEVAEKEEEEDLDELIGNLLDDEQLETEETETLDETVEVAPDTEEESGEKEFDLGTIFEEEVSDTEESLSEMLGDVEEEAVAAEPEEMEAPPFEEEEAEKAEPTHTILVVDDSVVIRKMVEIALENENYNIIAVATGKEALKYLDDNDPDLIILDIMLSDVNGLDVLKAIKASKDIPVVMLSAKDTPRETGKAKQLGADDFIPKPFKDEELVSKVKELIKA